MRDLKWTVWGAVVLLCVLAYLLSGCQSRFGRWRDYRDEQREHRQQRWREGWQEGWRRQRREGRDQQQDSERDDREHRFWRRDNEESPKGSAQLPVPSGGA